MEEEDSNMSHEECRWCAHLPYLGLEPVGVDKSLKSVMHGHCDARPAVTFSNGVKQ